MTSRTPAEHPREASRGRGRDARDRVEPTTDVVESIDRGLPRRRLAGVDGCRGGWVVATRDTVVVVARLSPLLHGDESPLLHGDEHTPLPAEGRASTPHDLGERGRHPLLSRLDIPPVDVLGVDMPIGLPVRPGRAADAAARAYLGPRRASVFPAPARRVLPYWTHGDANGASRAAFGLGLPLQTFHLFDKIREVDDLVRSLPEDQRDRRLVEIHPECSFRAMTGRVLPAKRTAEGWAARAAAIVGEFGDVPTRLRGAARDDILDAFAVLWSVERFARGEHIELPPAGSAERDECGLLMRIVV